MPRSKAKRWHRIFLETAAGAPVTLIGDMAAPGFSPRTDDRLELAGSKASAVFDRSMLTLMGGVERSEQFDFRAGYQASFDAVIGHFIDRLLDGGPFETDVRDNLETLRIVEQAYAAAESGAPPMTLSMTSARHAGAPRRPRHHGSEYCADRRGLSGAAASTGARTSRGRRPRRSRARQLAAGAIGITCAKLGEAEVMAAAGIGNILIANQIVGPAKIARLIALMGRAETIVAVDSIANIDALSAAAVAANSVVPVVIEVDIGMKRAGVEPGAAVVALADAIAARPGLALRGVMGWESHAIRIADPALKERTVVAAVALLTASAAACRAAGHDIAIVSCGGTGTFPWCIRQPGVTEVQIGGGIFSDRVLSRSSSIPTSPTR